MTRYYSFASLQAHISTVTNRPIHPSGFAGICPWCATRSTGSACINLGTIAALCDVSPRTVNRWVAAGQIRENVADMAAIAFGSHPAEVWPEWFEDAA